MNLATRSKQCRHNSECSLPGTRLSGFALSCCYEDRCSGGLDEVWHTERLRKPSRTISERKQKTNRAYQHYLQAQSGYAYMCSHSHPVFLWTPASFCPGVTGAVGYNGSQWLGGGPVDDRAKHSHSPLLYQSTSYIRFVCIFFLTVGDRIDRNPHRLREKIQTLNCSCLFVIQFFEIR